MNVDELLMERDECEGLQLIVERCGVFLEQSNGLPLLKNLPTNYDNFQKVKVRMRKRENAFDETFNEAFGDDYPVLRQRAVFANGPSSFEDEYGDHEPFYIFPVDGYQFLYNPEVQTSTQDYKSTFDTVLEQFGPDKGHQVIVELLQFTYTGQNLYEGISLGAEIIIYNIPFYYAVREASTDGYSDLLTRLTEL